jgi:hypothetical protein
MLHFYRVNYSFSYKDLSFTLNLSIEPRPPLNKDQIEKDISPDHQEEAQMLLRRNSIQNLFNGYDFDIEQLRHQI